MGLTFRSQFVLFNLFLIVNLNLAVPAQDPLLKIDQGELKGAIGTSRDGRPFYKFMGIPYGQVKKRFQESILAPGWKGIRDATEFGDHCLQRLMGGEEDCLHINVYTPQLPTKGETTRKLPVLFFVHGGAFILGSGDIYGAEYFMDEDCVLVTINYRLGVFGFLNLGFDGASGNQGLKDQVTALKWVQANIHHFGGDKDNIMIFGESAGAASVSYLILTPLTKGLFHRAISQSGTAHPACSWSSNPDGVAHAQELANELNCKGSNEEILNCLHKLDANDILDGYPATLIPNDFCEVNKKMLTALSFIPSVETRPPSDGSSIFLPKPAIEIFNEGSFQPVPWIIGADVYEGFLFLNKFKEKKPKSVEELKSQWMKVGPQIMGIDKRPDKDEITEKTRQFYFEDRIEIKENLTNLVSDRMFMHATKMAAKQHSKKSPVYLYMFDKLGGFSLMTYMMHGEIPPKPTHADELTFQFKFNFDSLEGEADIGPGHKLYNFSKDFVKMWVHFATTGKPREEWNSKKISWEQFTGDEVGPAKWLHLDTEAEMKFEDPAFQKRLKFWKDLNL